MTSTPAWNQGLHHLWWWNVGSGLGLIYCSCNLSSQIFASSCQNHSPKQVRFWRKASHVLEKPTLCKILLSFLNEILLLEYNYCNFEHLLGLLNSLIDVFVISGTEDQIMWSVVLWAYCVEEFRIMLKSIVCQV